MLTDFFRPDYRESTREMLRRRINRKLLSGRLTRAIESDYGLSRDFIIIERVGHNKNTFYYMSLWKGNIPGGLPDARWFHLITCVALPGLQLLIDEVQT